MHFERLAIQSLALAGVLLLVLSCQAPPNPTPVGATAEAGASPSAVSATAEPALATPVSSTGPALVTPVASATPATPGSMAAIGQMLFQTSALLGRTAAGEVSADQLSQAMDRVATTARQMSGLAAAAPQGTIETRQMAQRTFDKLATLAAGLRDRGASLSPEQRKLATQQLQVLILDMADSTIRLQDVTAQTPASQQQSITGQMQSVQDTVDYMLVQYGMATPTPLQPTVTPAG